MTASPRSPTRSTRGEAVSRCDHVRDPFPDSLVDRREHQQDADEHRGRHDGFPNSQFHMWSTPGSQRPWQGAGRPIEIGRGRPRAPGRRN